MAFLFVKEVPQNPMDKKMLAQAEGNPAELLKMMDELGEIMRSNYVDVRLAAKS